MAWITAGAIALGSGISAWASDQAADTRAASQEDAAALRAQMQKRAIEERRRQFNKMLELQEPYREAGYNALDEMQQMVSDPSSYNLEETPGYQFRYEQGIDALNNSLAASGNRFSGRAMKQAQEYGQNFAKKEFSNQFNRLASLSGLGQTATNRSASGALETGQGIAGNLAATGNALAQGQIGAGSARAGAYAGYNQAIQGGIGNYLSYRQYNNQLNSYGQTGGSTGGTGGVAANVPMGG